MTISFEIPQEEEIVAMVSRQLTADSGRSFAEKSLRRMLQIARLFPDLEIVAALSREFGLEKARDSEKTGYAGALCVHRGGAS
jgi:hypothetical protein